MPPALLVTRNAVKRDMALHPSARGARKLLVTELYTTKEIEAAHVEWKPPLEGEKCSVQVMPNTEVAVFNQYAPQDRHFHKMGTEIYMVLEGTMAIEIEGNGYSLESGDMIVVNPNVVHKVTSEGAEFLCRVVTLNCGGAADKYLDS